MKVKVSVMREIIVEVDENVTNLANWYDNNSDWKNVPDSLIDKAHQTASYLCCHLGGFHH